MSHHENPDTYHQRIEQLSRASVNKHFDAYADIDWDAPENAIDPEDPRFILLEDSALGGHGWYRALPEGVRARLGLHLVVRQMKVGIAFENILSRGLLEYASRLPNRSPEFRYAHHEAIEEGQHQLMFQEFVNRAGLDARGLGPIEAFFARGVPRLGRTAPELFFLHVLGGEEPIDHAQREALRDSDRLHPLLRRILRIHVTEEARHVRYARLYLERAVPRLSVLRLSRLRCITPFVLASMARQMLEPPRELLRQYGAPPRVVREAYHDNPAHKRQVVASLRGLVDFCAQIGVVTPRLLPLWRWLGIWPAVGAGLLAAGS